VDFKNTIIILTSNIGSPYLLEGITPDGEISEEARKAVETELRARFRPEFLNRLDEIILFKPLTKENIDRIIDLQIADLNRRLASQNIAITLTEEAKQYVTDQGYDPVYGARPLKRYVQRNVETLAAKYILSGEVHEGNTIEIALKDGELTARVRDELKNL